MVVKYFGHDDVSYYCPVKGCLTISATRTVAINHLTNRHAVMAQSKAQCLYKCAKCSYSVVGDSLYTIAAHFKSCNGSCPWGSLESHVCPACSWGFSTWQTAEQHFHLEHRKMRTHAPDKLSHPKPKPIVLSPSGFTPVVVKVRYSELETPEQFVCPFKNKDLLANLCI